MHHPRSTFTIAWCLSVLLQVGNPARSQDSREIANCIGLRMVRIPSGAFTMGSPDIEERRREDEVLHEVTLSKDYYLGAFEVTQSQYRTVMGANPSVFQGDRVHGIDTSMHPVENVRWSEAIDFCIRLSDLPEEKKAGRVYRLPTEAEWEYACRAGSRSAYCFGNDPRELGDYGWFGKNSGTLDGFAHPWIDPFALRPGPFIKSLLNAGWRTHSAGSKQPNAWRLYDMHGNVKEWCSDWYVGYSTLPCTDPTGPSEGSLRVLRGGSFLSPYGFTRSAIRDSEESSKRNFLCGFRVAMELRSPAE